MVEVSFPGGVDRNVCRVLWADGRSAVACLRDEPGRARFEERVLQALWQQGAPVPQVLHFNGLLLVQEDLSGERLATLLARSDAATRQQWLGRALHSLHAIHQAGSRAGLDHCVPALGIEGSWLERHLRQLDKTADFFGIELPELPSQDILDVLLLLQPRFIKWDSRPGNAMCMADGRVAWFDWEHCGARNRLDDLVWLMCDEGVPFDAAVEQAVLAEYVPLFADGLSLEAAHRYTRIAGVLHSTARLGLILHKREDEGWWDAEEILAYDYIGVTLTQAQGLCQRAAAWAAREPLLAGLDDWFGTVGERLAMLE